MRGKGIWTASFGLLLVTVSITGCATSRTDFVVALPNGYQIVRGKSADPMIVKKSGGTVIPGPVASYAVIRDVVVGLVQRPGTEGKVAASASTPTADETAARDAASAAKPASGDEPAAAKTGYFVLETRTGALGKDLSEADYTARLKSLNIPPSPELSPPVLPK